MSYAENHWSSRKLKSWRQAFYYEGREIYKVEVVENKSNEKDTCYRLRILKAIDTLDEEKTDFFLKPGQVIEHALAKDAYPQILCGILFRQYNEDSLTDIVSRNYSTT